MKKKDYSLDMWLGSVAMGFTPWGEYIKVQTVEAGTEVSALKGSSYWGSGGYESSFQVFGNAVETQNDWPLYDNGFVSLKKHTYRLSPGAILYTFSDGFGSSKDKVFVCVKDEFVQAPPKGYIIFPLEYQGGWESFQIRPIWGGEPDSGFHLVKSTHGGGGHMTLMYFPPNGSFPVEVENFYWNNGCQCNARHYEADDPDAEDCICTATDIPSTVEEAITLLEGRVENKQ